MSINNYKNSKRNKRLAGLRMVPFALLLVSALPVYAQSNVSKEANDVADELKTLEPVTVTATRREESLQSIPVAVSVLDGGDLEEANLNQLEEIVHRVPSADYRPSTSTKNVSMFIRGVGTVSTSGGIEPTIATVVDGVVLAHPGQTSMDLLDVDRIEVLRGPQGTLFGKNASGGVFNIVTQDPSRVQYRYADAAYYGGNEKRLRTGVAKALSEGVAWGSLTGMYGAYDGNVTNVANGEHLNGYERKGARGKLVLKPDTGFKVTLAADYFDSHRTPVPVLMTSPDPVWIDPAALLPVVPSASNRQVNLNYGAYTDDKNSGVSGQIEWDINGYALTSITAFRQWDNRQQQDVDMSTLTFVHDDGTVSLHQVSQELRLASPKRRFFEYVAGAFYQQSKDNEWYRRTVGIIADDTSTSTFGIDNLNYAFFGEGVFNLTPTSRLIAGLRQTHNVVSYNFQRTTTLAADLGGFMHDAFSSAGETSETGESGRFGVQFDLAPNVMTYATYSRGYKGPAYNVYANMWAADTNVIKPETSNAYEIGLKSQGFDNRLRMNLALFSAKYENYQTMMPDLLGGTTVYRLVNAGQVGTSGLEVDVAIKPGTQWEFVGAFAETDAHVIHFNCTTDPSVCVGDGSTMPFAPRHRLTLGSNYYVPMGNGKTLVLGGDYRWQSEVQFQLPQNTQTTQGAYGIVNASVAIDDPMHGWHLIFVGKNLTNKSYSSYLMSQFDGIARLVPRDDQRYFGINLRQEF